MIDSTRSRPGGESGAAGAFGGADPIIPKPTVVCTVRLAVPVLDGFPNLRAVVVAAQQAPDRSRVVVDLGTASWSPLSHVEMLADALRKVASVEIVAESPEVATQLFVELHAAWGRPTREPSSSRLEWDE